MEDYQRNNQAQTFASLFEVLNRTFEIPAYQRAYSWNDNQIKQFLDDLREAQDSYYLGHYLFEQAAETATGKLWVIDGQQRLTTCILFFHVLCRELQARADYEASHLQAAYWYETFLQFPDSPLWKLKTVEYDNSFLQRLLDGGPLPTAHEDTKSILLIKAAYEQFSKAIKAAQTSELLHWGKLVAGADVTHLIVRDKKQAAQLFAFQNDRGKRLTNLEIVKSYVMLQVLLFGQGKQSPDYILHRLEERFATIYKKMTQIDLSEDEVLAYYWRSTLANPYNGDSVVESIKTAIGKLKTNDRVVWVERFVDELANAFHHVYGIEQDTFQAAKDLRTLNNMALSYPILLRAYRDGISQPTKQRLFSFLENLTFRYKLRGGRANIHERLVHHFFGGTPALQDEELQKQIDQFINMLRTNGGWGWYWGDAEMEQVLNQNFYNNPVDNYLLWRYERYLDTQYNPFTKPYDQFVSNESIEHIAPQTPRAEEADSIDWPGYGIYYNAEQPTEGIASGEWIHKLGNLMLLAQGQNSRVSNRAFTEKLVDFQEGQLKQHNLYKFLATDPNKEGQKLLLWDKDAIERRHKDMVEAAMNIWSLDNLNR